MKILRHGPRFSLCLVLLGAGLAATPALTAAADDGRTAASTGSLVHRLRDTAEGAVRVSTESSTRRAGFVRVARGGDLLPTVRATSLSGAAAKADAYLARYAGVFGATRDQLHQSGATSSPYGWTITYTQSYRGVPVFGGTLKANIDRAGDLTSVNGFAAPALDLSTTPRYSAAYAGRVSVATVRLNPPRDASDLDALRAVGHQLVVYRVGSTHGVQGSNVLAWVVDVTNHRGVSEKVVVDAHTGKIVNRWSSAVSFGTKRKLYDGTTNPPTLVWQDGDPFPGSLPQEEQNLMLDSGNSYWLYANTFDRDSFDGNGAEMITIENYAGGDDPAFCPNAQWDGASIDMCPGSEADDIVSHEWGHAYTQYTSGLVYQWQAGALNESYSDVWGETIDLINGREDGGEGDLSAARPVGQCSTHDANTPLVTINTPADIAKDCLTGGAQFGQAPTAQGVTGDVVIAADPAETGGSHTDACSALTNAAAVNGKVVLVDEGGCAWDDKAANVADAGGAAMLGVSLDNTVYTMSGQVPADTSLPTSALITHRDGQGIKNALAAGDAVNVTIKDGRGARTDSARWVMGEKGAAFGGALRDMWMPECFGDPGKVTDAEYKCSRYDNGGVHGNSGVPNHAYALIVDGGTYNGVTVPGIGLDKAANLWWAAQYSYLTPLSDFTDMADSLDAACNQLIGAPIRQLSLKRETPGAAADPFTAADCAAVAAMEQAVELRTDPSQCNFKPILAKGAPSACGTGYRTRTVFKDGFGRGLKKWHRSGTVVYKGGHGYPWKTTSSAPHHSGAVAFAPDPTSTGNCSGAAGDISSVNAITSRSISVPAGAGARLRFAHYVATEEGWDGGNVAISVNGGKFKNVPARAYAFNKPNSWLMASAEGNTNPLAGQRAFTGTDGGTTNGSWGTSVVNLAKAGVRPGDSVQVRFQFGRDGCNGIRGWYVDNVKVQVCKKIAGRHPSAGTRKG